VAVNGAQFLADLALVTGVAALATLLFHRLRQPIVLGYLVAGVLVGPHGPLGGLQDVASVSTLAQLGIVFLMFSIGLEFRVRRLARAGLPALGAAAVGALAVLVLVLLAGRALGWATADALVLGAILAISSTVIAAKAIQERGQHGQRWAELAMAILIAQDVIAIVILALLGAAGTRPVTLVDALGVLGRLASFAIAALVLGLLVVPRVVNRLARERADEVLVVTLAGLALGTAVLALLLGFSPALGAFLIGAVVAEASEAYAAEQRALPLRDLFTAVFFVSIGMLLDPAQLAASWRPVVALAALMVLAKVAVHAGAGFLLGARPRDAFKASLAVAQVGEFSLVIAGLGLALGSVSGFVLPATVVLVIGSALWTPYLVGWADPLYDRVTRRLPPTWGPRAARYTAWAMARRRREWLRPAARRRAARGLLNAGAVLLILLATAGASQAFGQWVAVRGLTDRSVAMLPWLAGGVLALPFAFNAARAAQSPRDGQARALDALLLALTAVLMGFAFLVGAPLLLATLPPLPLMLLGLAAFLGASVVLWETMAALHRQVEQALERAMGGMLQGEEQRAVLDALRSEYRLGEAVEGARVRAGTVASGATIRGLEMRARSGATLLAVRRGGHTVVNPAPHFVLEAGDNLLLLGEPGQLERARALLLAPATHPPHGDEDEPALAQILLDAASPLAGRRIAECGLRERTGATIVGVLRAGQQLPNPGADFVLAPGDVLLVVGVGPELRGAEALARAPAEPRREPAEGAGPAA
jgi:CPA2 family monovalent cation:H+ antiporter-2